jgi:heat shock protein HtpX
MVSEELKMKQIMKTTLLLGILTGMFMGIGYWLGGGMAGALMGLGIAAVMNFGMYWFSSSLVLKMQRARPIAELQDEQMRTTIERTVSELAKADGLPMPALYYVDTPIPNAFATGRSPKHAVVAVNTGILDILNDAELKAVLAHELGHVKNRDMLVSTIAATVAGAISFVIEMAFWANIFTGGDDDAPNPIAAMAMFILAPLAAVLIQMAISRSRELLADQHGAKLVGSGKDLASALQKLDDFKHHMPPIAPRPAEQSTAHLMFANMFSMQGLAGMFSTHPSTKVRVARLKDMDTRAGNNGPILERR